MCLLKTIPMGNNTQLYYSKLASTYCLILAVQIIKHDCNNLHGISNTVCLLKQPSNLQKYPTLTH